MPFVWVHEPQLPSPPAPLTFPPTAVSSEVAVVANTVNVDGTLLYNTGAVGYDVVYPVINTTTTTTVSEDINVSFANITTALVGTLNVSVANITTLNVTTSLTVLSSNIDVLYNTNIIDGLVSEDPTTPLGIASKQYVDALAANISGGGSSAIVGQIEGFSTFTPPDGWISTGVRNVSRTTYNTLFDTMSTTYGEGDESSTFGLPGIRISPLMTSRSIAPALPEWRVYHTSTKLGDGRIVLVGGQGQVGRMNTVWIGTPIDSSNIRWVRSTDHPTAMDSHATVLLNDGRLLTIGGARNPSGAATDATWLGTLNSNGTITWVSSTVIPRIMYSHSVSLLSDGRVFVVPGVDGASTTTADFTYIGTVSGTTISWVATLRTPNIKLFRHAQHTLSDGRVIVSGGVFSNATLQLVTSANVFIGTVSGSNVAWANATPMTIRRQGHRMNILSDGRLVVTGGGDLSIIHPNVAIGVLSGTSISWSEGDPSSIPYQYASSEVLSNDKICMLGGSATGWFAQYLAPMGASLQWYPPIQRTAGLVYLPDGRLLLTGGTRYDYSYHCEFGTFTGDSIRPIEWNRGSSLPIALAGHGSVILPDGRVLITGGISFGTVISVTRFGTISGTNITWVTGTSIPQTVQYATANLLGDGRILLVGGHNGTAIIASTYLGVISGNTITWTPSSNIPNVRYFHTTTVLPDNRILVTGGYDGVSRAQTYLGTIDTATPNIITWVESTPLPWARYGSSAQLLPDGRVLMIGGFDTAARADTLIGTITENSIAWANTIPLPLPRYVGSSTYMSANGIIVYHGGYDGSRDCGDSFIYDVSPTGIKI